MHAYHRLRITVSNFCTAWSYRAAKTVEKNFPDSRLLCLSRQACYRSVSELQRRTRISKRAYMLQAYSEIRHYT